jgi:cyanate permease
MSMIKLIFILLFFQLAGEALRVIPQHTPLSAAFARVPIGANGILVPLLKHW